MSYPAVFTMPEKVKIVLDYLEQGNRIQFEGREFYYAPEYLMLVTDARALKFLGGPPVERPGQVGVNMSFNRFLKMVNSFTIGDLTRMQQVVRNNRIAARE